LVARSPTVLPRGPVRAGTVRGAVVTASWGQATCIRGN